MLIEVQNVRNMKDIDRFRTYLAENYRRKDNVYIDKDTKIAMTLPIFTIYFFGFKLPEIPTPVAKISRVYTDLLTHELIEAKDPFIEQLTHDCYVIQRLWIKASANSALNRLLSFFEQDNFVGEGKMFKQYLLPIEGEEGAVKEMANVLYNATIDTAQLKAL